MLTCQSAVCGDGIQSTSEDCDDGDTVDSGNGCSANCERSGSCGDGSVQSLFETCDDGNQSDGDYCSADCQSVTGYCGDGAKQQNEVCEDGNSDDGDYCSSDCQTITGFCGDQVIQTNEGCDDGNSLDGDGCSSACEVELGWTCEGEPSACVQRIYVDDDATGDGSGVSWEHAMPDLAQAFAAAAQPATEIWVAAGTYSPGPAPEDKFVLQSNLRLIGGFAGWETSPDERDVPANVTRLSGDVLGDDIGSHNRDDNNITILLSDDAEGVLIDGVFISNARGESALKVIGGSLETRNATFELNGGAVRVTGAETVASFQGVTFVSNNSTALHVSAGRVMLHDCLFDSNGLGVVVSEEKAIVNMRWSRIARHYGFGLEVRDGTFRAANVELINNHESGLKVGSGSASIVVVNGLFYGNSSSFWGGAVGAEFAPNGGSLHLHSCTIVENSGMLAGVETCTGNVVISNSTIVGNSPSDISCMNPGVGNALVSHSCVKGGYPGTGNVDCSTPQFISEHTGDFRLTSASPAYGSGSAALLPLDILDLDDDGDLTEPTPVDLDGNPRLVGLQIDMGAYERQ